MRLIITTGLAVGLGLAAVACGSEGADDTTGSSAHELTGGDPASDTDFPATVKIGGCTAAKVGSRFFLLAAHCVDDSMGLPAASYRPGASLNIIPSRDVNNRTLPDVPTTVRQTYVHPQWRATCVASGGCGVNVLNSPNPPDVAVIEVNDDTPIQSAFVDARPLGYHAPLTIMGYGCENGLDGGGPSGRLKFEQTLLEPLTTLLHAYSTQDVVSIGSSFFLTPGQSLDGEEASLCFGDSGGPVYRDDPTQSLVVGINAYYSFDGSPGGYSYTNWHTRLDTSSRENIALWLDTVGADVLYPAGLGDVDGDGQITIDDANAIAEYFVHLDPAPFVYDNADTNCDGQVDIQDALAIDRYLDGIVPELSCN